MRIPLIPIALTLLGSAAFAHEEDDRPWFIQFGLGAVFSGDAEDVPGGTVEFDPGYSVSGGVGYHVCQDERFGFDLLGELFITDFKVDEGDLTSIPSAVDDDAGVTAWMLNGIAEWHFTDQFAAYGGLGVGWASKIEYDAWDSGNLQIEDDSGLAFQGLLGFLYNLGGTYDVLLGYRYFRTETVEIENQVPPFGSDDLDVAQHVVEVGFRWAL
jgi:opacity protein-like surface antigen